MSNLTVSIWHDSSKPQQLVFQTSSDLGADELDTEFRFVYLFQAIEGVSSASTSGVREITIELGGEVPEEAIEQAVVGILAQYLEWLDQDIEIIDLNRNREGVEATPRQICRFVKYKDGLEVIVSPIRSS